MSLKPLADIKAPSLINFDRDTFVEEIIERIKLNDDWDELWDGDLYQNASQMILNFFGYMHEKSTEYYNINLSEKFLNQAFSDKAIYENLSDLGIHVKQSTNAYAQVQGSISETFLNNPLIFDKFYKIYGMSVNDESIPFEIINKDENNKYDYLNNIIINADNLTLNFFNIDAYAGVTNVTEIVLEESSLENLIIPLSITDVEDDSIRIYYTDDYGRYIEMIEVSRFSDIKKTITSIFPNGIPCYKITYSTDNSPIITFSNELFGGRFDLSNIAVNGTLVIYARSAYGSSGNVVANGINTVEDFTINNKTVSVTFTNDLNAAGGSDAEDISETKSFINSRIGRDGADVVDDDIRQRLHNVVSKIKVDTPKYAIENSIPFMHAVHHVVPYREISELSFDNPDTYNIKTADEIYNDIINQVTDFCYIQGTHDAYIDNEFVSHFVYPDDSDEVNITYGL
jgi:hypothetical protein